MDYKPTAELQKWWTANYAKMRNDSSFTKATIVWNAATAAASAAAPQVVADERGPNEIDQAWDKVIEAEAISSQLRRENEALLSALKNIISNPSQCVSIADQAIRFND